MSDLTRPTGEALEDELYRRVSESERSHARHNAELGRELGIPRGHVRAMVSRAAARDSWRIAVMTPRRPGSLVWTYTGKAADHAGYRAEVIDAEGNLHPLGPDQVRLEIHRMIDERRGVEIGYYEEPSRPFTRTADDSTTGKGGEKCTDEWTPSDPHIEAQANPSEIRRCAVCGKPMPAEMRADAEVCSPKHRRLLHRLRKGDPSVHEAIRMVTNPPPCQGCGKPLSGKRAGTKFHSDYCRRLARNRAGVTTDKGAEVSTDEWTPRSGVTAA